jgi:sec-independent protein translocase protein TatA
MGILLEGLLFSPTEWLLILGVVLLMFGGKKIPEVMKGLGSGIKSFKQAMKDDEEESKPVNTPGTSITGNTSENQKQETASERSDPKNAGGN